MTEQAERFRADILDEPARLAALLDVYGGAGSPSGPSGRSVHVVSSSSASGARALQRSPRHRFFARIGIDAIVEPASAAAPMPPSPDTPAVFVSASGRTPETVEAAELWARSTS